MKIGVYFAYWTEEWKTDYFRFIKKVKELGFDILEISTGVMELTPEERCRLKQEADEQGVILTMGYGLPQDMDVSSDNPATRAKGLNHLKKLFDVMAEMQIDRICGNFYTYWPADYSQPIDKAAIRKRSIASVQELADYAAQYGIALNLEVLNRFESFMINDVREGVAFVEDVGRPNVKLTLDTFHMNIEEDRFGDAIRLAGDKLGHLHIGEANRKVPGKGRLPWAEIGQALKDIGYEGYAVMEPFVRPGGIVGQDIKIFRDLSDGADEQQLDDEIKTALAFSHSMLD